MKVTTVESARRHYMYFGNPVTAWSYKITTGKRCKGLVSEQKYAVRSDAYKAGQKMALRLKKGESNGIISGQPKT